jgi:hypothetical protein
MVKLLCDMHVHLYDLATSRQRIESTAQIVQSRYPNLNGMVLVVTKSAKEKFFDPSQKSGLLRNTGLEKSPFPIYLFYAYQVVTQENLEIHLYGEHSFADRTTALDEILDWARKNSVIAALPWGFGKWCGSRGSIIESAISKYSPYLVDSALRFHRSSFFEKHLCTTKTLYGTDPLPLSGDDARIGTLCSYFEGTEMPKDFLSLLNGIQHEAHCGSYLSILPSALLQLRIRLGR